MKVIDWLNKELLKNGSKVKRDGKEIVELVGYNFRISRDQMDEFEKFNFYDLAPYFNMFMMQMPDNVRAFTDDKFNRRMLFQFHKDYLKDNGKPGMPCIESCMVIFVDDFCYDVNVNLRSSEIERLEGDISLILHCVKTFMYAIKELSGIRYMNVNVGSFHKYMDYKYEPQDNRF